jgi:hypothetical protein
VNRNIVTKMEMPFCFLELVGKVAMQFITIAGASRARAAIIKKEKTIRRKRTAQSFYFFLCSPICCRFWCFSECAFCVSAMQVEKKRRRRLCHLLRHRAAFCICCGLIHISFSLSHSASSHFSQLTTPPRLAKTIFCFLLCALIISLFFTRRRSV